ncbi:MAG: TraB/GumN family protein [Rhizobiaceae bacterium]
MKTAIMKTLALALSLSLVPLAPAMADALRCSGINLLDKLGVDDPESRKAIADAAAKLPYGKGLLWKVTKEGVAPSYLFGTMHMADPRIVELPKKAQIAFDQSKTLTLEITEILDPKAMASKAFGLMKYTAYLDGSTLDSKMTKEQIELLQPKLAAKAGLPWNVAQKIRPWVLMGLLTVPACEMARKKAGKPFLDLSLGQRAKQAGKKITALETIEGQMSIMASLPEPMMVQAMVDTANMEKQLDDIFETMISLYIKGETGTIWAMMRYMGPNGLDLKKEATGYSDFQRVVVDQRNESMANESAKIIDKGAAFIALGALHLPGEKGILSILAQRGYKIISQ